MNVASLCSGYGGLELAVETIWPDTTVVCHAEIDPWASKVLAVRWPGVPNVGDLNTVDWSDFADVDVVTAGYPCQPFSTAGRREGENDARHLWPQVLRAVRDLRPHLVLLENVAGHLSLGFGRVLGDLAETGYDADWTCLRASDVGACHRRERVFIAAHPHRPGSQVGHGLPATDRRADLLGALLADTDIEPAWRNRRAASCPQEPDAGRSDPNVSDRPSDGPATPADTERVGLQGLAAGGLRLQLRDDEPAGRSPFGVFQPAVNRWAERIGRPAPPGLDGRRLNARFVEWMMGLEPGWVTDIAPRRHALRILGNGVVPQQAAAAYRTLILEEVAA